MYKQHKFGRSEMELRKITAEIKGGIRCSNQSFGRLTSRSFRIKYGEIVIVIGFQQNCQYGYEENLMMPFIVLSARINRPIS